MSFLILKYKKPEEGRGTLCVIVSKKVSKKATARNKIRRQIKAVIKQRVKEKDARSSITVVVNPKIIGKNFKEIENEINRFIPN